MISNEHRSLRDRYMDYTFRVRGPGYTPPDVYIEQVNAILRTRVDFGDQLLEAIADATSIHDFLPEQATPEGQEPTIGELIMPLHRQDIEDKFRASLPYRRASAAANTIGQSLYVIFALQGNKEPFAASAAKLAEIAV